MPALMDAEQGFALVWQLLQHPSQSVGKHTMPWLSPPLVPLCQVIVSTLQQLARATLRGSLPDALQAHPYLVQALCNLAAAPMPAVRPSLLQSPG